MSADWLPEGFENKDVTARSRVAGRVAVRIQGHRRRVRILRNGITLTALALLIGAAPALWKTISGASQAPLQRQIAQRDGANGDRIHEATSPRAHEGEDTSPSIPNPKSEIRNASPDVTLAKSEKGVQVAWKGNPKGEYVVYRCTSPKFDQCSIAGVVKGTRWEDDGKNLAPVVFYRVEPKA